MSEVLPSNEVLLINSGGASTRAAMPLPSRAENDAGVLHRYGPNVEIRRTLAPEIGGRDAQAPSVDAQTLAALTLTERLGVEAL